VQRESFNGTKIALIYIAFQFELAAERCLVTFRFQEKHLPSSLGRMKQAVGHLLAMFMVQGCWAWSIKMNSAGRNFARKV